MRVLILNGSPSDGRGATSRSIADETERKARAKGLSVSRFDLASLNIKPCRGCFACWVKHPGTCAIKDDEEPILRAMAASDILFWITPIVFGGYGPTLKKALDRSISFALPLFIKVRGEIHHPQRYEKRRSFLAFGTLPSAEAESERIFHNLVRRNGINLHSVRTESRVLYEGADGAGMAGMVEELLTAAEEAI